MYFNPSQFNFNTTQPISTQPNPTQLLLNPIQMMVLRVSNHNPGRMTVDSPLFVWIDMDIDEDKDEGPSDCEKDQADAAANLVSRTNLLNQSETWLDQTI